MPQMRPEARPVDWTTLLDSQQKAVKSIVNAIDEAVNSLPKTPQKDPEFGSGSWLAEGRSSRAYFLSGDRGTGKTTVMLSVCQACLAPEKLGSGPSPDLKELTEFDELKAQVNNIQSRVIWLEAIDMELLPQSTNLLAAILARVSRVVQHLRSASGGGKRVDEEYQRGMLEPTPDYQAALDRLYTLRANVAFAWDGNIEDRKGSLDADSFAVEVMRAEEARLDLLQDLGSVLDELAFCAFRGTETRNPLFVLPVDDFDLNPVACLHLLKLLRMISVPRLFFLVLGKIEIAELIVNLKMANDLADVHPSPGKELAEEVAKVAGEVSANAMRKLIPPAQRVVLSPMTESESLMFQPFGNATVPELRALLQQCPIVIKSVTQPQEQEISLGEFLLRVGRNVTQESNETLAATDRQTLDSYLKTSPYFALKMFETTPRRVADLWMGFQNLASSAAAASGANARASLHHELVEFLAQYCRAILSEEPSLSPENRRVVPQLLRPLPSGRWDLTRLPIYLDSLPGSAQDLEVPYLCDDKAFQRRFQFGSGGGWQFAVDPGASFALRKDPEDVHGKRSPESLERQRELETETAGALALLHDLLELGPNSGLLESRLIHWDIGDPWATVEWSLGNDRRMKMRWPPIPGSSFFEFDRFLDLWRDELPKIKELKGLDMAQAAAFHWINAGTSILNDQPLIAATSLPTTANWTELHKRLVGLIDSVKDPDSPADKASAWLSDVAIIAMPERGLPLDVFHNLAPKNSKLLHYWTQIICRLTRQRRGIRLAEMHVAGLGTLAEEFRRTPALPKSLRPAKVYVERLKNEYAMLPNVRKRYEELDAEDDDDKPVDTRQGRAKSAKKKAAKTKTAEKKTAKKNSGKQ